MEITHILSVPFVPFVLDLFHHTPGIRKEGIQDWGSASPSVGETAPLLD